MIVLLTGDDQHAIQEQLNQYKAEIDSQWLTVREAARLQTFPDDYYFPCAWGESMRQIGNAVPVTLAYIIASSIRDHLHSLTVGRKIVSLSGKL
jgi:DNA (cytosine-5)-methyltransferase 1